MDSQNAKASPKKKGADPDADPLLITVVVEPIRVEPMAIDGSIPAMGISGKVRSLPVEYRQAFRFKMLALLWLNSLGIIGFALFFAFYPPINSFLGPWDADARQGFTWVAMLALVGSTATLAANSTDLKYPANFLALLGFTVCVGFFFGVTHPLWRNAVNWQILAYVSSSQLWYAVLATRVWPCGGLKAFAKPAASPAAPARSDAVLRWPWLEQVLAPRGVVKGESVHQGSVESPTAEEQGPGGGTSSVDACEPRFVLSPVGAALLSWAATLVGSAVCNSLWSYSNAGNFVFLHACALFLAWFFAHCTVAIEEQLGVDEYLEGVVMFWGNMVLCFCCCACTLCSCVVAGCATATGSS